MNKRRAAAWFVAAGVLPYTLVLDRTGNLVSRELGGLKEARLDSLIRPLL